jgi:cathepsin L
MKFIAVLLLFVLCACFCSALTFHNEWELWKIEHSKVYSCDEEEMDRRAIWLANKKYIEKHNKQSHKHGFTLKMNHFGDLTTREYRSQYYCYQLSKTADRRFNTSKIFNLESSSDKLYLPDEVDWRTKNAVTKVKDQGKCGSCYAFSAIGALEGAHALAHDKLISFSEQNVVDCSIPYGNHGCNGGTIAQSFHYIIDNNGIDTESSYPYKGSQKQCNFQRDGIGGSQAGSVMIPSGSEKQLEAAVATAGPVAVAIDASSNAFRFYEKGIFDEPNCSTSKLTFSALIIGYGKTNGKDYWLVKNSWGPNWGMKGYIMMSKDRSNQCGIATEAYFPTL